MLLRLKSYFTETIVLKCHNEVKHLGLESTLNKIRYKYWLIKRQSTVKNIIRKCVTCCLIQTKCVQPPQLYYFLSIKYRLISAFNTSESIFLALREKCPYSDIFSSVFSPNVGKCGPE